MPDESLDRNSAVTQGVLWGGEFYVALNGPTGEATEVLIGIQHPIDTQLTIARSFDPDTAERVAHKILSDVANIRKGT